MISHILKENSEETRKEAFNALINEGYINIKQIRHRKKKPKDREDTQLLETLPNKYEVNFKIKIGDIRYDKTFIIESTDESKVPELLRIRCKKEFSPIRSITKINVKLADENSKETSKIIKEPKNKIIKKDEKEDLEENVELPDELKNVLNEIESTLDLLDNMRKENLVPTPKDMKLHFNEIDFDFNGASNVRVEYDNFKNILEIRPNSVMLNYDKYDDYLFTVIFKRDEKYGPIRITAVSPGNAIVLFELIAKSKAHEDFYKRLLTEAVGYTILEEKTGKMASLPVKLINEMMESADLRDY